MRSGCNPKPQWPFLWSSQKRTKRESHSHQHTKKKHFNTNLNVVQFDVGNSLLFLYVSLCRHPAVSLSLFFSRIVLDSINLLLPFAKCFVSLNFGMNSIEFFVVWKNCKPNFRKQKTEKNPQKQRKIVEMIKNLLTKVGDTFEIVHTHNVIFRKNTWIGMRRERYAK